ncbi:hypothetical protein IP92_01347 [Pseudoduganella flava]|uniref:Uncharacterized protein n=2 Tax=Pseudoduganella flava TaxID=871742 RepID=A0A562Q0E1_9BURK|nr:hypothetical protein IP92_01347 [Pseudoduganella flava]
MDPSNPRFYYEVPYQASAANYPSHCDDTDTSISTKITSLQCQTRPIVTAHPSYEELASSISKALEIARHVAEPYLSRLSMAEQPSELQQLIQSYNLLHSQLEQSIRQRKRSELLHQQLEQLIDAIRNLISHAVNSSDTDFSDLQPVLSKLSLDAAQSIYFDTLNPSSGTTNTGMVVSTATAPEMDHLDTLREEIGKVGTRLELLEQRISSAENFISRSIDPLIEKEQRLNETFDTTMAEIRRRQTEVESLVSVVANTATAGSFAGVATKEEGVANLFRVLAILFMLLALVFAGYSLLEAAKTPLNLQASAFRLAFAIMLSIPAAYLAKESTKHRRQQHLHLRVALELTALGPFSASLPSETQDRLKEDIARRIFGRNQPELGAADYFPINIQDFLLAFLRREKENSKKADGG